jgi:hypothetical protein
MTTTSHKRITPHATIASTQYFTKQPSNYMEFGSILHLLIRNSQNSIHILSDSFKEPFQNENQQQMSSTLCSTSQHC